MVLNQTFNKSYLKGFIVAVGILSPYIFSDDSLSEELKEFCICITFCIYFYIGVFK